MLPPQLWRLLTSFLVTGPGFGILLDPYFLYTYGSQLETDSPRLNQPGDMAVYVAFVCTVILALNATVMGGFIFTQSLVLALAYTYSQDNPDKKMSYFIATFRVKWLPYVMLLMTLFMSSPDVAMIQGSGLVAAHLYDFLTRIYPAFGGGRNFLKTPSAVKRFFGGDAGRRPVARGYGTAFAGQPTAAQPASGASTGFSSGWAGISGAWGSRGTGRRLGGD
ncbi:MAG: hypothetical protein M1832_005835 [Thelocarpon impressellum]|nr:MAG: hypothetical protein M1832_005835 [Thelocarpon impressellum]